MSTINFDAELYKIGSWTLLRLPKSASAQHPSQGRFCVTLGDAGRQSGELEA
jgi:hypothetical protein